MPYGDLNKVNAKFLVLAGGAEIASGERCSDDADSANDAYNNSPNRAFSPVIHVASSHESHTYHSAQSIVTVSGPT